MYIKTGRLELGINYFKIFKCMVVSWKVHPVDCHRHCHVCHKACHQVSQRHSGVHHSEHHTQPCYVCLQLQKGCNQITLAYHHHCSCNTQMAHYIDNIFSHMHAHTHECARTRTTHKFVIAYFCRSMLSVITLWESETSSTTWSISLCIHRKGLNFMQVSLAYLINRSFVKIFWKIDNRFLL